MARICTFEGRTSYSIQNRQTEIFVSAIGGNTVAFFCGEQRINPYFIAPWWKEKWLDGGTDLLNVCRGNFFACPMGGDEEGYLGDKQPVHGFCANETWEMEYAKENELHLRFEKDEIRIKKEIIYQMMLVLFMKKIQWLELRGHVL